MDEHNLSQMRKPAFTLIELLVVIALIAILAAILFPVFTQVRERGRMSVCIANMRNISSALEMYAQDHDGTFPYLRFTGGFGAKGRRSYVWRNAIRPYLRSVDVFGCPSNPLSRAVAGQPPPFGDVMSGGNPARIQPGDNGEGWEVEPGQRMPTSYAMNHCATTWYPANTPEGRASPPLRHAELVRAADTISIAECTWGHASTGPEHMWLWCHNVFAHPAGKMGNFIYFDGHVRNKKWLSTLYPLTENHWQANEPNPDPNNRVMNGGSFCQWAVPSGPAAKEFQTVECRKYQ